MNRACVYINHKFQWVLNAMGSVTRVFSYANELKSGGWVFILTCKWAVSRSPDKRPIVKLKFATCLSALPFLLVKMVLSLVIHWNYPWYDPVVFFLGHCDAPACRPKRKENNDTWQLTSVNFEMVWENRWRFTASPIKRKQVLISVWMWLRKFTVWNESFHTKIRKSSSPKKGMCRSLRCLPGKTESRRHHWMVERTWA